MKATLRIRVRLGQSGVELHYGAFFLQCNGEGKSLRHVAMVAKFLDDNKSKRHLKSGFVLFQTSSILFNFI